MTELDLRPARVDEVDAVLEFWAVAGENDARPVDTAAALTALLARDPDALIVAELDGTIVGTVIAGWDGWRAHLYRLAVHPLIRRQGLARALVTLAEARLSDLGAARGDAMVLADNELGAALWRSLGYAAQEEWRRWVRPLA